MAKCKPALLRSKKSLWGAFDDSRLDRPLGRQVHELEHGKRSWAPTIDGPVWLARNGFSLPVASRRLSGEPEEDIGAGFAELFAELDMAIDAPDPVALMVFPEMDSAADVPEITEAC
jgi:hypothetical protein